MLSDLRYALRRLAAAPAFAAAVVACLALGIGVNVALFGVVSALLLRPPAGVEAPESLKRLRIVPPPQFGGQVFFGSSFSYPDLAALRERRDAFSAVAASASGTSQLTVGAGTDGGQVAALLASADYFAALGVRPAVGRFFGPARAEEDLPLVVLSDGYWRRAYGGDRGAVGQTLVLNGRTFQIVGVAPPRFVGFDLGRPDVWIPLGLADVAGFNREMIHSRNMTWLSVVGRLRPGVSAEQASQVVERVLREVDAAAAQSGAAPPGVGAARASRVVDVTDRFATGAGDQSPVPVWLLGASFAVLLVACANVANLLLVRAERGRREIATRIALGAGGGRVARQLLAESLVLASLGGALGLVAAAWGVELFTKLPTVPPLDHVLDYRVAAFTAGAVLLATVAAGLVPSLRAGRTSVAGALVTGTRATARRSRLQAALMVAQLGASLALLAAAGLFVRSLRNVRAIDVGFDMEHLLAVSPPRNPNPFASDAERTAAIERAAERVRRVPGVRGATLVATVPYQGSFMTTAVVPGHEPPAGAPPPMMIANVVDTAFFRTMAIPVLRGRAFDASDVRDGPGVLIVSEAFARKYWPGRTAVGQCVRLTLGPDASCATVVGVVGNTKTMSLQGEPEAVFYTPFRHDNVGDKASAKLIARVDGDPVRRAAAVRAAFQSADARLPFSPTRPVADGVAGQLAPWQLGAAAFTLFGALALVVAAVGLYGVVSYTVAQRAGEFAVRMALGARATDVLRLVVRQGLWLTAAGVVAGALVGAAATRALRAKLYGVSPYDLPTFAGVALTLIAVALLATWIPARRAARIDPMAALRSD